ncbi:MAG: hypothetical protein CMH25_02980 [Micavibrio sp.]|nr:hypothetical protein [Micavibrio sp.]|tara:strand:+ start:582465 stop:583001 length:537 start_codon:yes stop_codon:yes gene_type:complete
MAQAFTDTQAQLIDAMKMIERQVMTLAPDPDKGRGFAFATADSRASSAGDDMADGIIVDMALDVVTGGMSSAATIGGMDASAVVDVADEFYVDRAKTNQARSRSFGLSFRGAALGSKKAAMQEAFEGDLKQRVQLERAYMILRNKLDQAPKPGLDLEFDLRKVLDPDYKLKHPAHMAG